MDANMVPIFVGLDYHMNSVQVCAMNQGGVVLVNQSVPNDWRAIAEVVPSGGCVSAGIEACTGAADLAEELMNRAGWSIDLAHPGYVRRMKQNPDKTDFSDSRMLADLERVGYLPRVWLAPKKIRELRRLVRYRQQKVDALKTTKMRVKAILRDERLVASGEAGGRWTKRWIAWLRNVEGLGEESRWIIDDHLDELERLMAGINRIEKRLHAITDDDPIVKQLCAHPGIGPVTSWVMRAMIGRFDRFRSGKQLARFCGVSPRNDSSGERQKQTGMIKAGDDLLKCTLIQAGHRLARHDPHWAALSRRLKRRGKHTCVRVAAIVNRWIRRLFHDLKEMHLILDAA